MLQFYLILHQHAVHVCIDRYSNFTTYGVCVCVCVCVHTYVVCVEFPGGSQISPEECCFILCNVFFLCHRDS